jgi:hypothetical protein
MPPYFCAGVEGADDEVTEGLEVADVEGANVADVESTVDVDEEGAGAGFEVVAWEAEEVGIWVVVPQLIISSTTARRRTNRNATCFFINDLTILKIQVLKGK